MSYLYYRFVGRDTGYSGFCYGPVNSGTVKPEWNAAWPGTVKDLQARISQLRTISGRPEIEIFFTDKIFDPPF